ncbi:MAG: tRNA (adenosine(37)-N6)-dimethylallyltransferase MiaA [Aureispira sp.]
MNLKKTLLVIAGPTASGKTALGIQLAQHYQTAILSADSRQFYKEMEIGTAKPSAEERAAAPHHFIDSLSIQQDYNIGDFERDAVAFLEAFYKHQNVAILVGGSGLYIKAVCEGLDIFPAVPTGVRERLMQVLEEQGIEALQEELAVADPVYYAKVDRANPHRLIRALEICRSTGQAFSSFQGKERNPRLFKSLTIAIQWERAELYARINKRVDQMVEQGLVAEARTLHPYQQLNALQTVGYKELFDHFNGLTDLPTAIELIKRNTRRYAKRQLTWLRKQAGVHWVSPNPNLEELTQWIKTHQ